jgi:hypothetical protein
VIGGQLTQFIEPWLPELKRRAAALNPFETSADYIRMCRYTKHAGTFGVALYFIKEFVENI